MMQNKSEKRLQDVPLSESTISPSLSAIQKRCKSLFDTGDLIDFGIDETSGGSRKLPEGAYNPYDHKD